MKYMVTHSCGHEEEVNLFGSTRERERKLEWLATIPCRECQEREAKEALEKRTEELGLPDLQGSEKQIEWAANIRVYQIPALGEHADKIKARIDSLGERIARAEEKGNTERVEKHKKSLDDCQKHLAMVIEAYDGVSSITESHWWIEHRDDVPEMLVEAYEKRKGIEMEKTIEEEKEPAMVIMEPEKEKTSTVVTLTSTDNAVIIRSDRDEHIRLTVKRHGFVWDGSRTAWIKPVTEMTGPATDLGPDTARILLEAGIPVKSYQGVFRVVQEGNYKPECHKWVAVSSKDASKLAINCADGVKNYPEGKTTYNGDYVIVDPARWREVREFAGLNGYEVTRGADELLRRAEAATVSVKPASKAEEAKGDPLKTILDSSGDVLDDLKEEE